MKVRVLIFAGMILSGQTSIGFAAGNCSAGQLDTSYGSNGFLQISPLFSIPPDVPVFGDYEGLVNDANGNAYTLAPASVDSDGDTIGAVLKAAASGVRDLSFGGFGAVVPGGQPLSPYGALARDSGGRLLVASAGFIGLFDPSPTNVIVANRYSASGVVDTTYGDGVSGVATIPLDNVAFGPIDLRAASDGSVVIAASANDPSSASGRRVPVAVKLTPAGALDPAFGTGGISYFYTPGLAATFGVTGKATDVVIQSNGKILVAGRVGSSTSNQFFVARLLANGTLDTTFGASGGITVVGFGASVAYGRKMAVQSDGKIVVVGGLAPDVDSLATATGVLRLTSSGLLDTTFNGTGQLTIQGAGGGVAAVNLTLQDNDKILLAGTQFDAAITTGIAAVMRLTSTGQPDATFGTAGVATIASPLGGNAGVSKVSYVPSNSSKNILMNVGADNGLTKGSNYLAQLDSGTGVKCH